MPRRARRPTTLAFLLCISSLAGTARAGRIGIQGTFTGDLAWTDNVMNAPTNAPAALNLRPPVADFFFELRPGFILSSGAPRFVSRLEYFFQADLFAKESEGNSYSNTLSWQGFYLACPKCEILFSVLGQQGRLNTFNLNEPSAAAPVTVLNAAAASTDFAQVSTSEVLLYHLPQAWNLTQSIVGRAWFDLEPGLLPNVYEVVADVGAMHRWKIDSLGIALHHDFVYYDAVRSATTDAVVAPVQAQLLNSLIFRWRRDWTPFWNTEGDAGVIEANNLNSSTLNGAIWQPTGLAAVRYNHRRGSGELAYQHMTQPNAVAASTFVMDEVALRGTLPFPEKSHLYLSATVAYQHAREVDFATGLTVSTAEIAVVDATLRWQPRQEFGVFARFSFFDQFGHPEDGALQQLHIERAVAMLGVNITYPGAPVARVPTRQAQRVDSSDQESIPEPHSQAPEQKSQ